MSSVWWQELDLLTFGLNFVPYGEKHLLFLKLCKWMVEDLMPCKYIITQWLGSWDSKAVGNNSHENCGNSGL